MIGTTGYRYRLLFTQMRGMSTCVCDSSSKTIGAFFIFVWIFSGSSDILIMTYIFLSFFSWSFWEQGVTLGPIGRMHRCARFQETAYYRPQWSAIPVQETTPGAIHLGATIGTRNPTDPSPNLGPSTVQGPPRVTRFQEPKQFVPWTNSWSQEPY